MDENNEIKLVVDPDSGLVMAQFSDGTTVPVKTTKNDLVYVEVKNDDQIL